MWAPNLWPAVVGFTFSKENLKFELYVIFPRFKMLTNNFKLDKHGEGLHLGDQDVLWAEVGCVVSFPYMPTQACRDPTLSAQISYRELSLEEDSVPLIPPDPNSPSPGVLGEFSRYGDRIKHVIPKE